MKQWHDIEAKEVTEERGRHQRFSKRMSQFTRLLVQNKEKSSKKATRDYVSRTRNQAIPSNRNRITEIQDESFRARPQKLTHKRNFSALSGSPKHIVIGEPHFKSGSLFDGDKLLSQDQEPKLRTATLQVSPLKDPKQCSVSNVASSDYKNVRDQATSVDTIDSKEEHREGRYHQLASTSLMSLISRIELPQVYTKSNSGESDLTLPFLLKKFDEIRARYRDPNYPLPASPAKVRLRETIGDNNSSRVEEQSPPTSTHFEACHHNELRRDQNQSFASKEPFMSVEDFDFEEAPTSRHNLRALGENSMRPLTVKVRAGRRSSTSGIESNESSNTGGSSSISQTAKDSMSSASVDLCLELLVRKPGLILPEAARYLSNETTFIASPDSRRCTPPGILIGNGELNGFKLAESVRKREEIRNAGRLTGVPHFLPLNRT